MSLRICDLQPGDRVAVTWHRDQLPVTGTVVYVANGYTTMKTDAGQCIRLKATMKIQQA